MFFAADFKVKREEDEIMKNANAHGSQSNGTIIDAYFPRKSSRSSSLHEDKLIETPPEFKDTDG